MPDKSDPNRHARRAAAALPDKATFIAALLRKYPQLRVETLPNGEQIVHGIRLKTAEELRASQREDEK
jgi:hypothetical protein